MVPNEDAVNFLSPKMFSNKRKGTTYSSAQYDSNSTIPRNTRYEYEESDEKELTFVSIPKVISLEPWQI